MSKSKVAIAATNHSKLDVSSTHITTQQFLHLRPVYYRHMLPKEHLRGQVNLVSRLSPLQVPTYGRARINVRYFYVPFRTVFPNANEFFTDAIASNYEHTSLVPFSPTVSNAAFLHLFLNRSFGQDPLVEAVTDSDLPADFVYSHNNVDSRYKFTFVGRCFYDVLVSLGYDIVWNDSSDYDMSALALLAYAKVYLDWYSNSQYMDDYEYCYIDRLLHFNDPSTGLVLTSDDLLILLGYTQFVVYDGSNEYFTNAWDSPTAPNPGNGSITFQIPDVTTLNQNDLLSNAGNNQVKQLPNGTPYMYYGNKDLDIGTQFIHDALKAMTDAVKRHQLSGARAVDRFLVDYGVNLDSAKMNRSIFVGTKTHDVDFGSVMSNADTASSGETSNLGDYAGVGFAKGSDGFDFYADEFGIFLALSSVLPSAELVQGIDRNNFHIYQLDFWNPNYDNLSCQAIGKNELYVSRNGNYADPSSYLSVFGFAPRYAEYKVGRSRVTGDFLYPAHFAGGDSWNLARLFSDDSFDSDIGQQVHSLSFTKGMDAPQYSRIFNDTTGHTDPFFVIYHFACESLAPCKSLFDSYDFEDEAKKIVLESNGTKLN